MDIAETVNSKTLHQHSLSVIVPTLNDKENLPILTERIHAALKAFSNSLKFEVIIIDDHSTDGTFEEARKLATRYSWVKALEKKGEKGKAYSLLEGIAVARHDLLCIIDADLQYPPEAIPEMLAKLYDDEADVVITNRVVSKASISRRSASRVFKRIQQILDSNKYDTQSGLKLFRHDILGFIDLQPTRWTFDLELLAYAETLGCRIVSVDIELEKRNMGDSKLKLTSGTYEILRHSLKLRFKPYDYIPFNEELNETYGLGFFYKGDAYIPQSDVKRRESALERVLPAQKLIVLGIVLLIVSGFVLRWHTTLTVIIAALTVLYFADLLFNLFLIYRSFSKAPEIHISKRQISEVDESEWPTYTVLCPLYRESSVLPQFVRALSRLNYDFKKLQVMLLLEEDDLETIATAKSMRLPNYFEIVVVPHSYPKTKPKACNYGLRKATGEYIVIYDAEDVPDPMQLKEAYLSFKNLPDNVACVQGKLNFYNPRQNTLTRAFTAEYSLWFDLVLTGLQSINAPIPLGGTSNHFKTSKLLELGGWDAFNVTEDADLGMRIVKRGYRTAIMDSVTLEEANSQFGNWFRQRTRWVKGYMQTYLVHTRRLRDFPRSIRGLDAVTFQLVIGGKVLSMLINPVMWLLTIAYFCLRAKIGHSVESFYPAPVLYLAVISLLFGNFLYLYYYMIGCAKREHYDLIKYAFLVPLYWLAMSAAAYVACIELLHKPHYWNKTKHGLHLVDGVEINLAEAAEVYAEANT